MEKPEHPRQFCLNKPNKQSLFKPSASVVEQLTAAAKQLKFDPAALISAFVERQVNPDKEYEMYQITKELRYVTDTFNLPKFVVNVLEHVTGLEHDKMYSNKYRHSYDMQMWSKPTRDTNKITINLPNNVVNIKLNNWRQIANFRELKNLKSFTCHECELPESIIFPPTLEHLDLSDSNCRQVNWKDLINLKSFNGNNTYHLSYANVFPESLEILDLTRSNCGLIRWNGLPNLRSFIGLYNKALPAAIEFPATMESLVLKETSTRDVNWNSLSNLSSLTIDYIPECALPVSLESLTISVKRYNKPILLDNLINLKVLNIITDAGVDIDNMAPVSAELLDTIKLPYAAGGINVWEFTELITANLIDKAPRVRKVDLTDNTGHIKRASLNIIKLPPSVEQLAITNIDIGSIFWEGLVNLQRLSINTVDTYAHSLPTMLSLPNTLTSFYIKNCDSGIIVNWENLTKLTTLVARDVFPYLYDDDYPSFLHHISNSATQLETLYISNTDCTGLNVSDLVNLKRFTCINTNTLQRRLLFSPSIEYIEIPNSGHYKINLLSLVNLKEFNDIRCT